MTVVVLNTKGSLNATVIKQVYFLDHVKSDREPPTFGIVEKNLNDSEFNKF